MEDTNVQAENSNQAEEVTLDVTEETTTQEENVEENFDWKAEALKQKEYAQNQKIRAEKAEKLAKQPKVEAKIETSKPSLSTSDLLAVINAKIHQDDIGEVEDYAKYKGISIAEALKSGVVKTLLADKEENRKVANATNAGPSRRGSVKVSGDVLLEKARNGEITDDVEALAQARFEAKKRK